MSNDTPTPEDLRAQLQQAQQTAQIAKQIATEATEQSKAYRGMCEDFKRLADYWQQKAENTPHEDDREVLLRDCRTVLASLIKGIDDWNEGVQKIVGRQADYKWGDLEAARALLARLPR